MPISELVALFGAHQNFPIKIEDVRHYFLERNMQDSITFYEVELDTDITKGQFFQFTSHDIAYGQPKLNTIITVASDLTFCWKRFVLCKEMTHIFDKDNTKTATADEIAELTRELSAGVPADASDAFWADRIAEFKTLAILAPKDKVIELKQAYESGQLSNMQIATFFRVPVIHIPRLMSQQYLDLYDRLLED